MASPLPTPLAAALGVVPAVFDRVRRLPARAVRLPLYAVSSALTTVDTVRREYDDLAERGERLVARLRGETRAAAEAGLEAVADDGPAPAPFATAPHDAAEAVGQVVSNVAPLVGRSSRAAQRAARAAGDTVDRVADAAGDAVQQLADTAGQVAETAGQAVDTAEQGLAGAVHEASGAAQRAADTLESADQAVAEAADRAPAADLRDAALPDAGAALPDTGAALPDADLPDAEAPKGVPTPPRPSAADTGRVDSAATPSVRETVEQAVQQTGAGATPEHDDLPLPDYDHMTLGSLRGRMRALTVDQLVAIRAYEKAHADRLPVVTMLDNRIAKLSTDPSAMPSGPVSTSPAPEQLAAATGPSGSISPATTNAPPINPPSQGDPTNPAQPRR